MSHLDCRHCRTGTPHHTIDRWLVAGSWALTAVFFLAGFFLGWLVWS